MDRNAKIAIGAGLVAFLAYWAARPQKKATKAEFVRFMTAIAPQIEAKYGIKPNITIDQASLESGFGQSQLATEGFNLYGIKASKAWLAAQKPLWTGPTEEFYNGQSTMIRDAFKKYKNWRESVYDWADLISGTYKTAYGYAKAGDLVGYGNSIYKTGYSTHPLYAQLLATTDGQVAALKKGFTV